MNLPIVINKLLSLLNIKAVELLKQENPTKSLVKQIRLALKNLHPDAGGSAEEFDCLHKIYEAFLLCKKQTDNFEQAVQNSLTLLAKGMTKFNADYTDKKIDFDAVLNEHIVALSKRKFFVQVNISELVLHFNKLSYCQVVEQPALLHDLVVIPLNITAIEPDGQTNTVTNVELTRCVRHSLSGNYNIDLALSLKPNSTLKISVSGFEQPQECVVTDAGGFVLTFDENMINLKLLVVVTLE